MRSLEGLARSFSLVAASQVLTLGATFAFTVAQGRYLSTTEFGHLSVALSVNAILALVVDFGLNTKLPRDVAQRPETAGKALVASLVVRFGMWCLAMPIVWVVTIALEYGSELQTTIFILAVATLIGGISSSLGSYFQGREKFVILSMGTVVQRGSAAALGVTALVLGLGMRTVAVVYVAASALQVAFLLPGMRRYPVSSVALERSAVLEMAKGTAMLGFFWMLGAVYYNVDMVILQRLAPPENVAWYAAAYRLFGVALAVIGFASSMVLYPVISRLSLGSREELRSALERSFTLLLACGVFVGLTLAYFAGQVVGLVFPEDRYAEAATALRLLTPAIVAMYANGPFFMLLLAMGFERRLLVMAAALAVLNPLTNLVFVPMFQQNASALLTSATEAVVLLWAIMLTPRDLRAAANTRSIGRVAFMAVPLTATLWILRDTSMFLAVPVSAVVYGCAAIAVGVFPRAEVLRIARAVLGTMRGMRKGEAY